MTALRLVKFSFLQQISKAEINFDNEEADTPRCGGWLQIRLSERRRDLMEKLPKSNE